MGLADQATPCVVASHAHNPLLLFLVPCFPRCPCCLPCLAVPLSSLSAALSPVPPGVAPASCLLFLSVGARRWRPCAPAPAPSACTPTQGFPHNVDCPVRGGLVTALLPPLWRAPPCAWGSAADVEFAGTSRRE